MASGPLAEDIRRRLGDLSPAERKVARVLLSGHPSAGFETIAVLAERAAVSAPTVIRFVNRLGYRGFPDFQAALRAELDERNASPLTLYPSTAPAAHSMAELGVRVGRETCEAITRTFAELPPHDLERAVALLSDRKRRVTLVGGRFTHLLAQYLGLHLMQLRDDVGFLPDRDVERTAVLTALTRRDVLVVFDFRQYEPDKAALARLVQEAGGKVVLFTDRWLSPATVHAEVVLPNQVAASSPYDSLVPTLATVEAVVPCVVAAMGEDAHDRMERGERTARAMGLY